MYTPTAAQVPGLTEKNQSRLETAFSAHGIDVMGAYALTDRLAIEGSWYFRRERQYRDSAYRDSDGHRDKPDSIRYLRTLPSIGLAYTVPLENGHHFFLSTSAGYGRGRMRMSERDMRNMDATGLPPAHFSHYYASLQRIYVQPAFLIRYDVLQLITSVRWSGVRYGFRHGTSLKAFSVSPHTTYSFMEGAMTLRFSPPGARWLALEMQGGAALPGTGVTFDYHAVIGNAGISVDPVGFIRWTHHGRQPAH
jgi:hypothetical protein